MRGVDHQQSGMFSYISAERRVPKDHPLRAIRIMVDVALIEFRIIYLQGKEVGLLPEGHHQSGSAAHPLERATSMDAQLRKGARAEVR